MTQVNPQAYLFAALLVLTLPLNWILAAAIAALWHELCHILMLRMLKGNIHRIRIHWNGCVIETDTMGKLPQFISILAGPIGSLSLLALRRITPQIAVCGLIQGIYNLLPVMPLDGGRLLLFILYQICPRKAEQFLHTIEMVLRIGMTGFFFFLSFRLLWNPLPAILVFICNLHWCLRKIPCKPSEIGVQ